jgi:hypothetical protein
VGYNIRNNPQTLTSEHITLFASIVSEAADMLAANRSAVNITMQSWWVVFVNAQADLRAIADTSLPYTAFCL